MKRYIINILKEFTTSPGEYGKLFSFFQAPSCTMLVSSDQMFLCDITDPEARKEYIKQCMKFQNGDSSSDRVLEEENARMDEYRAIYRSENKMVLPESLRAKIDRVSLRIHKNSLWYRIGGAEEILSVFAQDFPRAIIMDADSRPILYFEFDEQDSFCVHLHDLRNTVSSDLVKVFNSRFDGHFVMTEEELSMGKDSHNDLNTAHKFCTGNKEQLMSDRVCGCFHCLSIYDPKEIHAWIDKGTTGLCPHCGVDSILGESCGYPITKEFLQKMQRRWFDVSHN